MSRAIASASLLLRALTWNPRGDRDAIGLAPTDDLDTAVHAGIDGEGASVAFIPVSRISQWRAREPQSPQPRGNSRAIRHRSAGAAGR